MDGPQPDGRTAAKRADQVRQDLRRRRGGEGISVDELAARIGIEHSWESDAGSGRTALEVTHLTRSSRLSVMTAFPTLSPRRRGRWLPPFVRIPDRLELEP